MRQVGQADCSCVGASHCLIFIGEYDSGHTIMTAFSHSTPTRDPSLWGIFGLCLWLAPVTLLALLLILGVAKMFGLGDAMTRITSLFVLPYMVLLGWTWILHLHLRSSAAE